MSSVVLAEPPDLLRYRVTEFGRESEVYGELVEYLDRQAANTQIVSISRPQEVLLDTSARVQGRYRMTTAALSQLCSNLAPGLSQLVGSLSGSHVQQQGLDDNSGNDPGLAIRFINDLVKLRFPRVDGYSMITDQSTGRIDGFVGRKYAFFSNQDFVDRLADFVADTKPAVVFSEAALQGRRLILRYRTADPAFEIPQNAKVNEPYFGGFHFGNSETGDCSVKAATSILRVWCSNRAVSEFQSGSKIPHIRGAAFHRRLAELLDRIADQAEDIPKLRDGIVQLANTPLGLGIDNETHDKRVKTLQTRLQKRGLKADFAREVIEHTLLYGSYRAAALQGGQNPMTVYSSRSAYDLFNALTHRAKTMSLDGQERAEQIAFSMIGKPIIAN